MSLRPVLRPVVRGPLALSNDEGIVRGTKPARARPRPGAPRIPNRTLRTDRQVPPSALFRASEVGAWLEPYNPAELYPRRNRFLYSQEFSNAVWQKTASGTGSIPVVTANAGLAPDGTMTADRIVFDKGAGTTSSDNSSLSFNGAILGTMRSAPVGKPMAGSVYLKTEDGSTKTMRFDFNGATPADGAAFITVDGTWRRFTISLASYADATRFPVLRLRADIPGAGGASTDNQATVLAWGMQFELGTETTEYQPVTDWQTEYAAGVDLAQVRLWQDSARTVPVSMYEQPVGCIDSLINGHQFVQATAASRPVLSARYNILQNSEVLATSTATTIAASYRLRFSGTGTITLTGTATGAYAADTDHTIVCTAGTLTATVAGTVTFADMRLVADTLLNIPQYQRTGNNTAAVDYDTQGFPPYLRFDASDDFLSGALDLSAVDKLTAWTGATKREDAAQDILFELTANSETTAGSFGLAAPSAATDDFLFRSGGTVAGIAKTVTGHAAPTTKILTCTADIAAPSVNLRVNGVEGAAVTTSQGTGNYANSTLYIGRRGGVSLAANCRIYGLVLRGATTDATLLAQIERYMAQRSGVPL